MKRTQENICEILLNNSIIKPCQHSAFIDNTCALCKTPKNLCNDPTTIPLRYIHPKFSLTKEAIRLLRDHDFETLINLKKLHLVLDLDKTLLHSSRDCRKNKPTPKDMSNIITSNKDVFNYSDDVTKLVKLRPGIREFLEQASAMFEISIYSRAKDFYAKIVAEFLKSKVRDTNFEFSSVISKNQCTKLKKKSLDFVPSFERVVLIVDDRAEVWDDKHKANLIKIKPYWFFETETPWVNSSSKDDQELARVLSVLKKVHTMFYDDKKGDYSTKDVRQMLERVQSESIIEGISCDSSNIE